MSLQRCAIRVRRRANRKAASPTAASPESYGVHDSCQTGGTIQIIGMRRITGSWSSCDFGVAKDFRIIAGPNIVRTYQDGTTDVGDTVKSSVGSACGSPLYHDGQHRSLDCCGKWRMTGCIKVDAAIGGLLQKVEKFVLSIKLVDGF